MMTRRTLLTALPAAGLRRGQQQARFTFEFPGHSVMLLEMAL